jgi:sugar lactone lactonase YvrE
MKYKVTAFLAGILMVFNTMAVRADYVMSENSLGTDVRVPIPDLYTVTEVNYSFGEAGVLNNPQDLFIDDNDYIYIADTGNNRIIKLNPDMSLNKVYDASNSTELKAPEGIYIDKDGDLYIGDTGNKRVVHLTNDGTFVEEFKTITSELTDYDNKEFVPSKLYISLTGYLYVVRQYTLMMIDGNSEFKGFVASAKVTLSVMDIFLNNIFTDEQRAQRMKATPETIENFVISDDGMIYCTTLTETAQIKKINGVGNNIYEDEGTFGEVLVDTRGMTDFVEQPDFVDIAVDDDGIITVVDFNTNNLYQYSQEGMNIGVFGGPGYNKGKCVQPSSIAVDSKGNIYLLDAQRADIQIFEPTEYCKNIHAALSLYSDGKYIEAVDEWTKVQKLHEGNEMAQIGMAKALFKQGEYKKAMEYYKMANNRKGYSEAYKELRQDFLRQYFLFVVLAGIIIIIVLLKITGAAKYFVDSELG